MTTGPGDEQAVPPRRLRASHVDREQAISALKAAFVHGRVMPVDEFDARVGPGARGADSRGAGRDNRRHPGRSDAGVAAGP